MEIIKRGSSNPRKFICINCGCEFVAKANEYWRTEKFGVVGYECGCPECTYTVTKSEPWEEDNDRSGLILV